MKDKIKSIISRMVFLGITGALLMGGSSSCNKDKDKQNQAPAPSYDAHDVQSVQKFFEQNSNTGTKTNEAIFKENDANFNAKEPATWNNNIGNPYNSSIEFRGGRLSGIRLNSPDFGGDLDLTGCRELSGIELNGSNVASIKIPKESPAGKGLWFFENANNTTDLDALRKATTIAELNIILSRYNNNQPKGDNVLINIHKPDGAMSLTLQSKKRVNPLINVSSQSITVTLVD